MNQAEKHFSSFKTFYPYYLSEHQNVISRRLHFFGTSLVIMLLAFAIISRQWKILILLPVVGYCFAWIGHFFFENNKPATFKHPLYSLLGDFVMFKDIIVGKIRF